MQMTKDDGVLSGQHVSLPKFLLIFWCVCFVEASLHGVSGNSHFRESRQIYKFPNFLINVLSPSGTREATRVFSIW